jgi:hypothetical protein
MGGNNGGAKVESFFVVKCPEFVPDPPRKVVERPIITDMHKKGYWDEIFDRVNAELARQQAEKDRRANK